MIRIGMIGCGAISLAQVDAILTFDDAKIVAAADISEKNLAAVCERTNAAGYADYKEMIDKESFDLAIISLPHALHREATCLCAERGIDVFLEKPMGVSSEDCDIMIDACKKANVMLWIGHIRRYGPLDRFAKELIDSGKYGKLVAISETRSALYFAETRPRWFLSKALAGGGMMMNLGAHSLDRIKFFCDDAKVVDAAGQIHIPEGAEVENTAQALIKLSNGVSATLNLIGNTSAPCYMTTVFLTDGEIRISDGKVLYCGRDGVFQTRDFRSEHLVPDMQPQLRAVIDTMVSGEKKPIVTGEYGKDVIHTIKRIYGEER